MKTATVVSVKCVLLLASWLMLNGGCSLHDAGRELVSSTIDRQHRDRTMMADRYARIPALSVNNASVSTSHADNHKKPYDNHMPVTLRDFIVLALKDNPDIHAAEYRARAAVERIAQVTSLPDPNVMTKIFPEPVRTAEGDGFFILGISQAFPVPEKLDQRGRIALDQTRIALEQLQQTRLQIIADVKRAYFQLYVLDRSIETTQANQMILRGLIDVARTQVATGRRSQDDVMRAHVESSNIEAELIRLRQQRGSTAVTLNALMHRSISIDIEPLGAFDVRRIDTTIDALLSQAMESNPKLKRMDFQVQRDQHAVELARLVRWPDFTLGFEWMQLDPRSSRMPSSNSSNGVRAFPPLSEDGRDNWAITFGFSLPIWHDKNRAVVAEAEQQLAMSRMERDSVQHHLKHHVQDALDRVVAQRDLAVLFRDTIIPQAEQTYQVSQASYAAGNNDFLYVVDHWRKWLTFTIQYHRALGELERSVADLEQEIGLSMIDVE